MGHSRLQFECAWVSNPFVPNTDSLAAMQKAVLLCRNAAKGSHFSATMCATSQSKTQ